MALKEVLKEVMAVGRERPHDPTSERALEAARTAGSGAHTEGALEVDLVALPDQTAAAAISLISAD